MTVHKLDKIAPKLSELELATAIDACRRTGAVNAAEALSKHITRLEIEITLLKREPTPERTNP